MRGKGIIRRLTAVFTALLIAISVVPGVDIVSAVDIDTVQHVADTATHNGWKQVFLQDNLTTENAGGIWVDKSVFDTTADFDGRTVSLTDEDNFLVALSAIASTKSITGYSYIPTDTVLVLDISGSMFQNISSKTQAENSKAAKLAEAANEAIKSLLANNNHNRVGVILYSTSGVEFLPVGRYSASDDVYIRLNIDEEEHERDTNGWRPGGEETYYTYTAFLEVGDNLKVYNDEGVLEDVDIDRRQITGGTYIQYGMEYTGDYLTETDTVIDGGSFQAGVTRMPIIVLMSDGAATYGTTRFTDVDSGSRGGQGNGDGNAALSFVNQLTAIYTMKRIEEHYGRDALLYTLGVGVNNSTYAQAILNPSNSTATNDLWTIYDGLGSGRNNSTMSLELGGSEQTLRKYTPSSADGFTISSADKNYVDRYFSASTSNDITTAFQNIVDQIIIQSKYYPTHVTTGDHHLDGDITFKDEIGRFMEVKEIKGILLGSTLFSGEAVAKSLNEGALGTVNQPTPLGDELSRSVQTRIGVDVQTAQFLISQAYNAGQLYYDEETGEYSNYIGWYADADGNYVGFWNGNARATHPEGAAYINRSYGFLGVTGTGINASDMMYLSVQIHTSIETGHSAVIFKIPAALIPLIEYEITLEGTSYEDAKNIEVTRREAYPIRLVYEVGLRSDINELNVAEIVGSTSYPYVEDGVYSFYTNRWVTDVHQHEEEHHPDEHTNAVAYYTPSVENERYYYNEDTLIYSDTNGTLYKGETHPAGTNGTYYRAYYVFSTDGDGIETHYEAIFRNNEDTSRSTLHQAKSNNDGTWYISMGYLHRTTGSFYVAKPLTDNNSGTYDFVRNPVVGHYGDTYYATAFLGNNGLLQLVPAQGIKLTKTIDETAVPGTNTEFEFTITSTDTAESGTYDVIRYDIFGNETEETVKFTNGVASIKLNDGDEVYIVGLETGDEFTIVEKENEDYRLLSINGDTSAESVTIQVEDKTLSNADFVNTYIPKGLLVVSKTIEHSFGGDYEIDGTVKFDINIALDDELEGNEYEAIFESADGTAQETTVTVDAHGNILAQLAHGESIAIAGIPAGTAYTVSEADYSDIGFEATIDAPTGTIVADDNMNVNVVNTYSPESADTSVLSHVGTKEISGRHWLETDSFEFVLEKFTGTAYEKLGSSVYAEYDDVTNEIAGFSFDLSGEVYDKPGDYQYRIREVAGDIGGMTYSGTEYVFTVTVTDVSMTDGVLEISKVTSESAVVTEADGSWEIATPFTNTYKASGGAEVAVTVNKTIINTDGSSNTELSLAGYQFGIYNENDQLIDTLTTDESGVATGTRTYTVDAVGKDYVYTIREINTGVPGIIYSVEEYEFTVEVVDNFDGTISAQIERSVQTLAEETIPSIEVSFTNTYKPAAIVLEGTKMLDGRDMTAGEFEFEIYEGEDLVAKGTNDAHGRIVFDEIDYDTVGEHIYEIREVPGDNDTITYDDTPVTVKVNVTMAADGSLIASIASDSEPILFENTYNVEPTEINDITGTKSLIGRDMNENEFEFHILDEDGDIVSRGFNDEEGLITFEKIEYIEAGDYTYTVVEVADDNTSIDYDESKITIVVNVTDDGMGNLTATLNEDESEDIVFTNYYNVGETEINNITGTKSLIGRDMIAGEFEFHILDGDDIVARGFNDEEGLITFEKIEYIEAGDHTYTVVEVKGNDKEITYSEDEITIVVNVTDDGMGNLTATLNEDESEDIVFTNIYTYIDDNAYVPLSAEKVLNGRKLRDGEFSFELKDADGDTVQTAINDADGDVDFDTLKFETAGEFVYTISEVKGSNKDITYDETVYTVTITVTAETDGKLIADVVVTDENGTEADKPIFTNKYNKPNQDPINDHKTVTVKKEIIDNTGDGYKLDGFIFILENLTTGETQTAVSDANGYATFNLDYTYGEIGSTYNYVVSEVDTGITGMEYDTSVYSFTVKVNFIPPIFKVDAHITQNGKTVSGPVAVFVNTYNGIEQIDPPDETDPDPVEPNFEEEEEDYVIR